MQILDSNLYSRSKPDFLANNLNYLVNSKGMKTLLVYSDLKGEGKTEFISTIIPKYCSLFTKRTLIIEMADTLVDNLKDLLEVKKSSNDFVFNTKVKGLDYLLVQDNELNKLVTKEIVDFYDLIIINSKNLNSDGTINELPKLNIDGALVIRSKKTLGKTNLKNTNILLDKNIPMVGFIFNEAKNA